MLTCASSSAQTTSRICLLRTRCQPISKLSLHGRHWHQPWPQHLSCSSGIRCLGGSGRASRESPVPAPLIPFEAVPNSMNSLVSRPAFLFAAAVGFSIIAFDVHNSSSPHFLPQYIDQPAHAWVKANLPAPIKKLVADKLISDLFITGGIGGWVVAGAAGIGKSGWVGIRRLAIVLFMYIYGGGSISHGASPE